MRSQRRDNSRVVHRLKHPRDERVLAEPVIRERIGQVKADQKARGRYLGGKVPFGFRRDDAGGLVPHEVEQEAIREMVALRAGKGAQSYC
jgi:hypothetical protein